MNASENPIIEVPKSRKVLKKELVSVEDIAEALGCTPEAIEARLRCGDLPGEKFGRGWVIPIQALVFRLNELALDRAAQRRNPEYGGGPSPEATEAALAASPVRRGQHSVPPPRPQIRGRTGSE